MKWWIVLLPTVTYSCQTLLITGPLTKNQSHLFSIVLFNMGPLLPLGVAAHPLVSFCVLTRRQTSPGGRPLSRRHLSPRCRCSASSPGTWPQRSHPRITSSCCERKWQDEDGRSKGRNKYWFIPAGKRQINNDGEAWRGGEGKKRNQTLRQRGRFKEG